MNLHQKSPPMTTPQTPHSWPWPDLVIHVSKPYHATTIPPSPSSSANDIPEAAVAVAGWLDTETIGTNVVKTDGVTNVLDGMVDW
jgi:hypothetical protein